MNGTVPFNHYELRTVKQVSISEVHSRFMTVKHVLKCHFHSALGYSSHPWNQCGTFNYFSWKIYHRTNSYHYR